MKEIKFHKVLRELLKDNHLTQERFADAVQVSAGTVTGWLNKFSLPNVYTLVNIAAFFHVTTDYLLFGTN